MTAGRIVQPAQSDHGRTDERVVVRGMQGAVEPKAASPSRLLGQDEIEARGSRGDVLAARFVAPAAELRTARGDEVRPGWEAADRERAVFSRLLAADGGEDLLSAGTFRGS